MIYEVITVERKYNQRDLETSVVNFLRARQEPLVWLKSTMGVALYDGENWTEFTPENSILPSATVITSYIIHYTKLYETNTFLYK